MLLLFCRCCRRCRRTTTRVVKVAFSDARIRETGCILKPHHLHFCLRKYSNLLHCIVSLYIVLCLLLLWYFKIVFDNKVKFVTDYIYIYLYIYIYVYIYTYNTYIYIYIHIIHIYIYIYIYIFLIVINKNSWINNNNIKILKLL